MVLESNSLTENSTNFCKLSCKKQTLFNNIATLVVKRSQFFAGFTVIISIVHSCVFSIVRSRDSSSAIFKTFFYILCGFFFFLVFGVATLSTFVCFYFVLVQINGSNGCYFYHWWQKESGLWKNMHMQLTLVNRDDAYGFCTMCCSSGPKSIVPKVKRLL